MGRFIKNVVVPNRRRIFAAIMARVLEEFGVTRWDAFLDGTKQEANANKYKFVWDPITYHRRLTARLSDMAERLGLEFHAPADGLVKASEAARLHSEIAAMGGHERDAKATMAIALKVAEYEVLEAICGPGRKSFYKTDRDATAMCLKRDYYSGLGSNMHAAYNVQAITIAGLPVCCIVTQSRTDIGDFVDAMEAFREMYGRLPDNVGADAGYGSKENYGYLERNGVGNYVKHQSWDGNATATYPDSVRAELDGRLFCLAGKEATEVRLENRHPRKAGYSFFRVDGCLECPFAAYCKRFMKDQTEDFKIFELDREFLVMKRRAEENLLSPKGIEMRVNRSVQAEGIFGIAKQDELFDRFRRRGIENVECEFILHLLGIAIGRLLRYYKTGKKPTLWTAPEGLRAQQFKKPSSKKLAKKGKRINRKQYKDADEQKQ